MALIYHHSFIQLNHTWTLSNLLHWN